MLRDLELHPVYDSAEHDLVQDLITPLLEESQEYWRGVGFFTSGWLRNACKGVLKLVSNGGVARIVTSPVIEKADWEALQIGDAARQDLILREILREQVIDLGRSLAQDTLNALAWMVAEGVIEFRFAIARDFLSGGDYHDKVGVFVDCNSDVVAIHGSFNDSLKGSMNGEAFSVFRSWDQGQRPFVDQHQARLIKLWDNRNSQFMTLLLPEAIRQEIACLRTGRRPWLYPRETAEATQVFTDLESSWSNLELRSYQREAIDAWKRNNFRGILEMATGTGKTFTALAASIERRNDIKRVAVLIFVPYLHLLEQWLRSCDKFGLYPILCSSKHPDWPREVQSKIQDYRLGVLPSICILAVHATAASKKFKKAVQGLPLDSTILIADEVHNLGAPRLREALLPGVSMRLGLSATPRRWYDQEGTRELMKYFCDVCFEFPLEQAIGKFLTPYRYFPFLTTLAAGERQEYEELSERIAKLARPASDHDVNTDERLKKLLIRRAQIVSAAQNKLPLLLGELHRQMTECGQAGVALRDVLIYCAPGKHAEVLGAVSAMGIRCHEFVHTVSMDRREAVLRQFADGDIQALIAIHCLDEGVDIPSTRIAYFLASTSNPREFVQRRGRILRPFEGKVRADVYDFIVVPEIQDAHLRRDSDIGLLRREMPRFAEFAASSQNEFEARATIWEIVNAFEALNFFDIKPWDIYHEVMESVEIKDRS